MPPKKREKDLDGQKGPRMDQIQADHELFLQAFESEYRKRLSETTCNLAFVAVVPVAFFRRRLLSARRRPSSPGAHDVLSLVGATARPGDVHDRGTVVPP